MIVINQSKSKTSHKIPNPPTVVNPWYFIPTLYFAEGLPYVLINSVSVIIYKNMGIDNAQIAGWTSLLYLPWVLKMLWSPLIEIKLTTKKWIVYAQLLMAVCLSLAAITLFLPNFFLISLIVFSVGAFISATNDTATDGFYLQVLNKEEQDIFAGIRPVFYRLAVLFASGFLVFFAGTLEKTLNNIALSWAIPLGLSGLIFALFSLYHWQFLPTPETKKTDEMTEKSQEKTDEMTEESQEKTADIFYSYFNKPHLLAIIAFILMYRFGEALLLKLTNPFLLDKIINGGLELSTQEVGLVYGTFGLLSLIVGGILGGIIITKYGLQKSIFPLALLLNLPNIFYLYMAVVQPHSTLLVCILVSLEQFGYGLGLTAFMIYLMKISAGKYKTAHYAISTGIMALGMMLPGVVSGYLQEQVGYKIFFLIVCLFSIPSLLTVFIVPKTTLDFLTVILEKERKKYNYNYQKITGSLKVASHDLCVKTNDGSPVLIVDVIDKESTNRKYQQKLTNYRKKLTNYQQEKIQEYWLIDLNELSVSIYSFEQEKNRYQITKFIKESKDNEIQSLNSEIKSEVFPKLKNLTADELLIV